MKGVRFALGIALAAVASPSAIAAETATPPAVLVLFSLRSTAPAVTEIEASFRGEVEKAYAAPVDLHIEHLDLPDAAVAPYARRLVDLLREKYAGRRLDVVVVEEGQALRFLLENREALFPGVPVVFTDVTRRSIAGLSLPPDVTGVLLVLEGQRTVRVALDLHPGARRVVLVAGSSPADRAFASFSEKLVQAARPGMETLSLAGLPLDEQLRRLAQLPDDSVVVFVSYRADSLGRSMVSRDVLRLVTRASRAPVYGAVRAWLGLGIVGGDLVDFRILGERTAALTSRILRGEKPSSLAPIEQPASRLEFDWRGSCSAGGSTRARLPLGSVVLFREKTLWSEHGRAILGALALLVVQTLLIGALLVARRQRIRAQAGLRAAEQRYRTVADFTYDWEYWRLPDKTFAYVSPSCARLTGYEAEEFHRRPSLLHEIVVPEDQPRWEAHAELALAGKGAPGLEIRIRRADGQVRWIEHVCSPVTDDGRALHRPARVEPRRHREEALGGAAANRRRRDPAAARAARGRQHLPPRAGRAAGGLRRDHRPQRRSCATSSPASQQVAPTSSTVLLQGETGVGKELVAHAIHNLSPRRAPARSSSSTARRCPPRSSRASSSATRRAPSPGPSPSARGASRSPTAAPSSSTRSASCPSSCRPSSCG